MRKNKNSVATEEIKGMAPEPQKKARIWIVGNSANFWSSKSFCGERNITSEVDIGWKHDRALNLSGGLTPAHQPHHGEVLDELAAERPRADDEVRLAEQLVLEPPPEHRDLPVVAAPW